MAFLATATNVHLWGLTQQKKQFWRTKQQQEIDFVEEKDGQIQGFEFKWKNRKIKIPKNFVETYKTDIKVIGRDNFRDFVRVEDK